MSTLTDVDAVLDDVMVVDVSDPADPRLDDFRDLNSVEIGRAHV